MTDTDEFLAHYGVKGMKWGVRKEDGSSGKSSSNAEAVKPRNTDAYSVDKDGRITIKKGHTLQRIFKSGKQSDGSAGTNYFSFTEKDNNIYTQMLGAGSQSKFKLIRKLASDSIGQSVSKETLKSPSRKEAFDILKSTIDEVGPSFGVQPFKGDWSNKKALSWYQKANANIVVARDSNLHQKYFENLQKKGYNILLDEADSGFLSELPIVVLDGGKSLRPKSVSDIKQEDLVTAKKFLQENDGATIRSIEDFAKE